MKRDSILPPIDCACATVRRAARLLTQLYDEELRPHLEAPHFALLTALEQHPGITQAALGRAIAADKTTISRNLALLRKKGWIASGSLTEAGRRTLKAAKPGWTRAQNRLKSAMPREDWNEIWQALDKLTNAAHRASEGTHGHAPFGASGS